MIASHYFAHEASGHPTLLQRVLGAGYFDGAATGLYAENIAVGPSNEPTAHAVVDAWLASPDHRANLFDGRLLEVGLGAGMTGRDPAFYSNYPSVVYTADFGRRDGVVRKVAASRPARGCRRRRVAGGSTANRPHRYCPRRRRTAHRTAAGTR
jgi:hypothetical protein